MRTVFVENFSVADTLTASRFAHLLLTIVIESPG
jgi:hypothetical protein